MLFVDYTLIFILFTILSMSIFMYMYPPSFFIKERYTNQIIKNTMEDPSPLDSSDDINEINEEIDQRVEEIECRNMIAIHNDENPLNFTKNDAPADLNEIINGIGSKNTINKDTREMELKLIKKAKETSLFF